MPLTRAQCTNCGAILDVDPTKEAAVCTSCGTPYIVEKAINQYQTINNVTYRVENAAISGIDPEYARIKGMAEYSMNCGAYEEAYKQYSEIFEKYRHVDSNNTIMLIKAYSHGYSLEYFMKEAARRADWEYHMEFSGDWEGKGGGGINHLREYLSKMKTYFSWIPTDKNIEDVRKIESLISRLESEINRLVSEAKTRREENERILNEEQSSRAEYIRDKEKKLKMIKVLLFPVSFAVFWLGFVLYSVFFMGIGCLGFVIFLVVVIKVECNPYTGEYRWKKPGI